MRMGTALKSCAVPEREYPGFFRLKKSESSRSGIFACFTSFLPIILPLGNIEVAMKHIPKQIGDLVKVARKTMGVTQKELALTSGTGLRFIIDLEKGKPTCQLGKALTVLQTVGIRVDLTLPRPKNEFGKKD